MRLGTQSAKDFHKISRQRKEQTMKLVGLDFETANPNSGSICAVGAALLEDGKLTKTCEWLVRPHASVDWMLPKFTEIHGIEYLELRESPEFPEIWDSLKGVLLSGECVIAHNAQFDLRHLKCALKLYSLPAIAFPYACSLEISRDHLPDLPSHTLDSVAAHFGFTFKHHDALDDAIACARIVANTGLQKKFIRKFEFSPNME